MEKKNKEHKTDGTECWCNPRIERVTSTEDAKPYVVSSGKIIEPWKGIVCKKIENWKPSMDFAISELLDLIDSFIVKAKEEAYQAGLWRAEGIVIAFKKAPNALEYEIGRDSALNEVLTALSEEIKSNEK